MALYIQGAMATSDLQLQGKSRMTVWFGGNYEWLKVGVNGASGTRAQVSCFLPVQFFLPHPAAKALL